MSKDLTGLHFGRLTVAYRNGSLKNGVAVWHCVCECGGEKDVSAAHLTGGFIQSCGCLKREAARANCLDRVTHGDMRIALSILEAADTVVALKDWTKSQGAQIEWAYAQRTGKQRMTFAQFCEANNVLSSPADTEVGKCEKAG